MKELLKKSMKLKCKCHFKVYPSCTQLTVLFLAKLPSLQGAFFPCAGVIGGRGFRSGVMKVSQATHSGPPRSLVFCRQLSKNAKGSSGLWYISPVNMLCKMHTQSSYHFVI